MSEASPTSAPLGDERPAIEPYVWKIAGVVILGMVMSILDTTIVNVALNTLGRELHSSISEIQWVITGYLLSLAAVIPVTGWAARRYGAKRVYMTSLVLFTAGSALCATATTTTTLVLFRVLQGAGGGMIMPLAMLIMAQVAGPGRISRVMPIVSMPAMLAPILGPVVGGLILENLHWSWIFLVNVPIGVVAFIAGWRIIPHTESGPAGQARPARPGAAPGRLGGDRVRPQRTRQRRRASGSPEVLVPIVAGIVLSVAFVLHALRIERPLLDVRLYRNRVFAAASSTTFWLGAALFGAMILVPLYYQEVRGENVLVTGLLVGPQGVGMLLVMPFTGRLTERLGGGRVALAGRDPCCACRRSRCASSAPPPRSSLISLVLLVRGVGIGLAFVPAMSVAFASMRPEQLSDASPQLNVVQRLGGAIGTSVLAVVLQRSTGAIHTTTKLASAFGTAYTWSLALAALALIPCVLLMRAENPRLRTEEGAADRATTTGETGVEPLGA